VTDPIVAVSRPSGERFCLLCATELDDGLDTLRPVHAGETAVDECCAGPCGGPLDAPTPHRRSPLDAHAVISIHRLRDSVEDAEMAIIALTSVASGVIDEHDHAMVGWITLWHALGGAQRLIDIPDLLMTAQKLHAIAATLDAIFGVSVSSGALP
jgi:hypothetical protein